MVALSWGGNGMRCTKLADVLQGISRILRGLESLESTQCIGIPLDLLELEGAYCVNLLQWRRCLCEPVSALASPITKD